MDERELRELVRAVVVKAMESAPASPSPRPPSGGGVQAAAARPKSKGTGGPGEGERTRLAKRVAEWTGAPLPVPPAIAGWKPAGDRAFYMSRTPARLGVGAAGTRYRTATLSAFLTDHAAARDAVASEVDPEIAKRLGMVRLRSAAKDRSEFLRRPDLGRRLSEESAEVVRKQGIRSPQVQIVAADGLSATALNVNLPPVLPALTAELQRAGVRLGTPFVISLGRVASADEVARITDADVLCLLVGERPGLKTAESMGAYVTYMKVKRFTEALRNVISNIHRGGLVPEEGARQAAALVVRALKERRTGVDITP